MKKTFFVIIAAFCSLAVLTAFTMINQSELGAAGGEFPGADAIVELPEPRLESSVSVEQTLQSRRSVRSFSNRPVSLEDVSQLLWAAQGITEPVRGFRTAPSAGATFPFEVYVVAGHVTGLDAGIYKYDYRHHRLHLLREGDFRSDLAGSALGQSSITDGAVNIVLTAIYERTTQRYGDRGVRYVHMEAGHIAQNVFLQAVALDLGSVPIGAFSDENVGKMLGIPENENALYILPVGKL